MVSSLLSEQEQDEGTSLHSFISKDMRGGIKLEAGFIGAGKVGTSLGKYFAEAKPQAGMTVKGYFSHSRNSAEDAARFTGTKAFEDIEALVRECDVIFLTVPDGRINQVWHQIRRYSIKGKSICHCSGSLSSADAFDGIEETGAFGYSVHPLFAVSDKYNAYRELADVFFTIEGGGCTVDGQAAGSEGAYSEYTADGQKGLYIIKDFLEEMGNPVRIIDGRNKTTYHCAAAMASNLVCGLIDQSLELMTRCGFTEAEAVRALAPILKGNMAHIAEVGPAASLTGPIERNDTTTVKKHLECLENDSEKELYRLLSSRLVRMAQQRHPDRDYAGMSDMLGKEK